MSSISRTEVTELLLDWADGDGEALDRLTDHLYNELHKTAHCYMRGERHGHTLQTTALINEAYLRLIDSRMLLGRTPTQFLALAAQVMRRILVDYARSRKALKRGAARKRVSLDEGVAVSPARSDDYLAIDEALTALARLDPRKSRVIELRFFGGLGVQETAEALGVSPDTVMRDWKLARVWIHRYIRRR